jgi:hypothetical protein
VSPKSVRKDRQAPYLRERPAGSFNILFIEYTSASSSGPLTVLCLERLSVSLSVNFRWLVSYGDRKETELLVRLGRSVSCIRSVGSCDPAF